MIYPTSLRLLTAVVLLGSVVACDTKSASRADSLRDVATQQQALATTLSAQKDSLTRVVLDADEFLSQMDSAVRTVKGLPRKARRASDPLAEQLAARKEM